MTQFDKRPPFECVALLLQGGGALGAYQAGVYQALSEAHIHPDGLQGFQLDRLMPQSLRALRRRHASTN
jgi:NTE family protein